jgi:SRSO17 transposase
VHLYLQGLLSHLPRKNAEDIATFVDVERQVIQDFIGTVPWDHRPLVTVLVGQVAERLGEPDGIIAFDPSSFPKRGTHSVGVKRQWCSHRGKVDNCQVGVFMGYVSRHDHALLDFRLSLPEDWARDAQRRAECHVPPEVRYHTRHEQCLEMLDAWGEQVPHGWVTGDDELGRHTRFRHALRERGDEVVALVRSPDKAAKLREAGVKEAFGVAKENAPVSKFLYPKFNGTSAPHEFTPLVTA